MNDRQHKKAIEDACVTQLARALGGTSSPEAGEWPDGWIEMGDERIPVEVVNAYERKHGEDPKAGSSYVPAYKKAELAATASERATGVAHAWGAHEGAGFSIPLDGTGQMPIRMEPVDPVRWVLAAVEQKIAKRYSTSGSAVLAVLLIGWDSLLDWELAELAEVLRVRRCPFREVWVLNQFGIPPQRVPSTPQRVGEQ